ncbi:hypothetical protein BURKHO8Y_60188 [Burkholderia sp. 8Y]|nr:hypothetical protein BURKHO8Y_60188 [Burkholderia sp. 8Y]
MRASLDGFLRSRRLASRWLPGLVRCSPRVRFCNRASPFCFVILSVQPENLVVNQAAARPAAKSKRCIMRNANAGVSVVKGCRDKTWRAAQRKKSRMRCGGFTTSRQAVVSPAGAPML